MCALSLSPTDADCQRRQSGQSVVELALAAPVLLTMLFGMVNIGVLITDKVSAAYATRQGARLAGVLGSGSATGLTTLQIDQDVCQTVLASAANLAYSSVIEIDVYQADSGGSTTPAFNAATQPYNSYNSSCTQTHQGFLNTARNQIPPNETSIGVNLKWRYTVPTGYQAVSVTLNDYAVQKASPVLG
jgi:Flp pilus assembly protein TadG